MNYVFSRSLQSIIACPVCLVRKKLKRKERYFLSLTLDKQMPYNQLNISIYLNVIFSNVHSKLLHNEMSGESS